MYLYIYMYYRMPQDGSRPLRLRSKSRFPSDENAPSTLNGPEGGWGLGVSLDLRGTHPSFIL